MAKDGRLEIRLREADLRWFQACADIERVSVSEWVRRVAVLRAAELLPHPGENEKEVA